MLRNEKGQFVKGNHSASEFKIGHFLNKGIIFTEEHRRKISASNTGKVGYWQGKNLSEDHKRKLSEAKIGKTGENANKWIKDRSTIKTRHERNYNDANSKQWTLAVYKRDNYKCKISNENCNGRLEAHHILPWKDFPEERYNINNGIILCHYHHPLKREEVKKLIPFFKSLVEVKSIISR